MAPWSPWRTPRIPAMAPLAALLAVLSLVACGVEPDGDDIIARGIEAHGGERFENARVTFDFRGEEWSLERQDGRFRYERRYQDDDDRPVLEGMTNDSTFRQVDGEPVDLDEEGRADVELDVNSVTYFAFLPFRLDDPAVQSRYMGVRSIDGELHYQVEVTFQEDGGGPDWDDRFIHWFHAEEGTLGYVAYRYYRGDGGTRFREAVNPREKGGLRVHDWVNSHVEGISDIAHYPDSLEAGALEHVSDVELENVEVQDSDTPTGSRTRTRTKPCTTIDAKCAFAFFPPS